jgi:putative transposase
MEQPSIRKTYTYKLKPSSEQARLLGRMLTLCHQVYNAAIDERREAWRMRGVSVSYYQQKAELPGITDAMPEYADVHSQVLQGVVLWVERAFAAFLRRLKSGGTLGYPRFHSRARYSSFTYPQVGDTDGAHIDNGFLVLSQSGRIAIRWSRSLEDSWKTSGRHTEDRHDSQEHDGW